MNNLPPELLVEILKRVNVFLGLATVCKKWCGLIVAAVESYRQQWRELAYKIVHMKSAKAYLFDELVYDLQIHKNILTVHKYDNINNVHIFADLDITQYQERKRIRLSFIEQCNEIVIVSSRQSYHKIYRYQQIYWKIEHPHPYKSNWSSANKFTLTTHRSIANIFKYIRMWKSIDFTRKCKRVTDEIEIGMYTSRSCYHF